MINISKEIKKADENQVKNEEETVKIEQEKEETLVLATEEDELKNAEHAFLNAQIAIKT